MSIPGEHTAAPQVWPGHDPVPSWETPLARMGRRGVNLVKALDDLTPDELSRMSNMVSQFGGPLMTRLGQTGIATTAGVERIHSLFRLDDPLNTSAARFAGSNAHLFRGFIGAYANIDTGYSGDPLGFCGINTPLTGAPYVIISDRSRQRKAQRLGAIEPFGTAPAVLTGTALGTQQERVYCQFAAGDAGGASAAANWTMTAGVDRQGNATGAPVASNVAAGVQFDTNPAGAAAGIGYYSVVSIARTADLSTFPSTDPITDDDLTLIQFGVSIPKVIEEVTVYLVCSAFTVGNIPGKDAGNAQAYFKTFRPDDFIPFHNQAESVDAASEGQRTNSILQRFKDASSVKNPRGGSQEVISGITESLRLVTPTIPAGINVWGVYGILGNPLRRGDWARVGTSQTGSPSWSTVTGIVIVITTNTNTAVSVTPGGPWAVRGGGDPDTAEPDATPYDYRVINVHSVTGSKGNPSAIQADANRLNPVRQPVVITPAATGIAAMRQWAFRRGGGAVTTTDWFFVGENNGDGNPITDHSSDEQAVTEETLEIDNDQPVTSVNTSGVTVLNQTLPIYFMIEDYCFGLGDPLQPGRLYRSKKGAPEQWPATEYVDACPATDELMNGGSVASAGFCFSRKGMMSVLLNADDTWTTEPTACREGLAGRWAMKVTPYGIAFVSSFGVKLTTGGAPEDLSSEQIGPLFQGRTVNGMLPIDFGVPTALLLEYHQHELWFTYQDTGGTRRHLIYSFFDKTWRPYLFAEPCAVVLSETVVNVANNLLLGGNATGQIYTHSGFTDDGAAIAYLARTGTWHQNAPRNEKLLSEVVLDGDLDDVTVDLTTRLNDETVVNAIQTATGTVGYKRYIFEPFGTQPQHARNVSMELSGSAPTDARVSFDKIGVTHQLLPAVTMNQPTPWEELPGGEGYCYGLLLTCDTGGVDKTMDVEYTVNNGAVLTAASLTVNGLAGRRKLPFTWASVLAQQIRLRPTGLCEPWIRYKLEWLTDPEPPRVQGWNTNWDDFGTKADKWLKGILVEADTFNAPKTVVLDIDNNAAVVNLGALSFNGRTIQHLAFAKQRGRVFRLRATDANFGKLYGWQPIFDEEPLALTRWESEERPFPGMDGRWQKPLEAYVCVRSSAQVTWQVTTYGSGTGVLDTSSYTIASTGGVKRKARIPLNAVKGLLFGHLFTAGSAFWLYREESEILVEDFNTGDARWVPLFVANDDLDPARTMGNAAVAAATPGGA